jgi:iron complex outermembrane receptor protein
MRFLRLTRILGVALLAVLPCGVLGAQEEAPAKEKPKDKASEQPRDKVTGEITVIAPASRVGTKAETEILETPQAIVEVPGQVLEEQQVDSLADALRNVSSIQSTSFGGDYNEFSIRGFSADLDGNFRKNGVETTKFGEILNSNVERVEVLKGPSSVLYGRLDPGGVINVVTKQPQAVFHHNVQLRTGQYDYVEGRFDSTGPLNGSKSLLYRLNASDETSGSYRDLVSSRSLFASPVLTWLPTAQSRLNVEYEHRKDQGINDPGLSSPSRTFDALAGIPVHTFLGEKAAETHFGYDLVQTTYENQLTSNWSLRSVLNRTRYNRDPNYISLGAFRPDGRTINRGINFREQDYTDNYGDVALGATFSTGPVHHRLDFGTDYQWTDLQERRFGGAIAPIDAFNPVQTGGPSNLAVTSLSKQDFKMFGAYLQDQVRFRERLVLQLGARLTDLDQKTHNLLTDTRTKLSANEVSPQVGLVYLLRPSLSVYGSYSESFAPTLFTDNQGNPFDPSFGDQYEVGVKSELLQGRLLVTAAWFQLTRTGVVSFFRDSTGTFVSVQGGTHRSRGEELDMVGRIGSRLDVIASYSHLDGYVVKDPAYAPGTPLGGAPRQKGSLWLNYRFESGLGLGAGVFHMDERKAFLSSLAPIPGYTTADAAISYLFQRRIKAQLTVSNLFNEQYFLNGDGVVGLPARPRTFQTSLSYDF